LTTSTWNVPSRSSRLHVRARSSNLTTAGDRRRTLERLSF
jgi:hypothetical protein